MGYRNIKKQKKLIFFLQIEDFDFSMSWDNAYYQFYKNAPIMMIMWIVKFITEKTDLGAALSPLLIEVESEENSI